jgi:hypothetical protein
VPRDVGRKEEKEITKKSWKSLFFDLPKLWTRKKCFFLRRCEKNRSVKINNHWNALRFAVCTVCNTLSRKFLKKFFSEGFTYLLCTVDAVSGCWESLAFFLWRTEVVDSTTLASLDVRF